MSAFIPSVQLQKQKGLQQQLQHAGMTTDTHSSRHRWHNLPAKAQHSDLDTYGEREREKHYISSSHLGLIRCLTPFRVRTSIASI